MPAQLGSPRMLARSRCLLRFPVSSSFPFTAKPVDSTAWTTGRCRGSKPCRQISPRPEIFLPSCTTRPSHPPSPVPELGKMSTGARCPSEPSHRPAATGLPCRKISSPPPPPYLAYKRAGEAAIARHVRKRELCAARTLDQGFHYRK